MHLTLQKWGNSAALRIPAPLLALLGVKLGDGFEVDITPGVMTLRATQPLTRNDAALAAIQYAVLTEDSRSFLNCWMQGDFEALRREWPNAPDAIFNRSAPAIPAPAGAPHPNQDHL